MFLHCHARLLKAKETANERAVAIERPIERDRPRSEQKWSFSRRDPLRGEGEAREKGRAKSGESGSILAGTRQK